jgi:hypothetical protein
MPSFSMPSVAERKEASGKAVALTPEQRAKMASDAAAFICAVCKASFIVTTKSPTLIQHVEAKHPKLAPAQCWPNLEAMKAAEEAKKK